MSIMAEKIIDMISPARKATGSGPDNQGRSNGPGNYLLRDPQIIPDEKDVDKLLDQIHQLVKKHFVLKHAVEAYMGDMKNDTMTFTLLATIIREARHQGFGYESYARAVVFILCRYFWFRCEADAKEETQ